MPACRYAAGLTSSSIIRGTFRIGGDGFQDILLPALRPDQSRAGDWLQMLKAKTLAWCNTLPAMAPTYQFCAWVCKSCSTSATDEITVIKDIPL